MGRLTKAELQFFLELIAHRYGFGYSDEKAECLGKEIGVGQLQAKLSMMVEVAPE